MKCAEAGKLHAYCAGELNAAEAKAFEQHALGCTYCGKALAQSRKIFDELRQMKDIQAPAGFVEDVRRKIASSKKSGLQKIFYPLRVKIPLELAATFLIGIFIYRVILPHHPVGKGPYLEVERNPVVETKTKKSDTELFHQNADALGSGSGEYKKKEVSAEHSDEILKRGRLDVPKDLKRQEVQSEEKLREEGRPAVPPGVPSGNLQSGQFAAEPKTPVSLKDQTALPPTLLQPSVQEKTLEKSADMTVVNEKDETAGSTSMQSAGFLAGKGNNQTQEAMPGVLDTSFRQQERTKEEKTVKGNQVLYESPAAKPLKAAQPLVSGSKAKVERKTIDGEISARYVWKYSSKDMSQQMFLFVESRGWRAESGDERTYEFNLTKSGKAEFLNWLEYHGKLIKVEDGSESENSGISQTLILDLEFEEAP